MQMSEPSACRVVRSKSTFCIIHHVPRWVGDEVLQNTHHWQRSRDDHRVNDFVALSVSRGLIPVCTSLTVLSVYQVHCVQVLLCSPNLETGTQWAWYTMGPWHGGLVHNGPGIQLSWDNIALVPRDKDTLGLVYTIGPWHSGLVQNGSGTQWSWATIGLVPLGLVHDAPGV